MFSLSKRSSGPPDGEDPQTQDRSICKDSNPQPGTSASNPPSLTSESRPSEIGAVGGLSSGASASGGEEKGIGERGAVGGEGERGTAGGGVKGAGREGSQYIHSKALPGK